MAQKKPAYPVQKTMANPGQPSAPYSMYPTQGNFSGHLLQHPHQPPYQPPYQQQYPQPYPQVNQQPGHPQLQHPIGQPNYGSPPPPYPGVTPNPVVPQQPIVQGTFDSGARFGTGASYNIPPPPPGVMPNSSQMAAASGQPVFMRQEKDGWLTGAKGGGYTFW